VTSSSRPPSGRSAAGQGMLQAQLVMQGVDGWADPLHRDARLPERRQRVGLRETDERHRSLMPVSWAAGGDYWTGCNDASARPAALIPVGPGRER